MKLLRLPLAATALAVYLSGCGDQSTLLNPSAEEAPEVSEPTAPAFDLVENLTGDQVLWVNTDLPDDVAYNAQGVEATVDVFSNLEGAPGGGLDIMVAMDGSGSVGSSGWNQEKAFVSDLVQATLPSPPTGLTRMGILRFSSQVWIDWRFHNDQTPNTVVNRVNTLNYPGGQTYTRSAVQRAIQEFNNFSDPGRGKLLLLITDGVPYPSSQGPCSLKAQLDYYGIKTVIVGVGTNWDPNVIACLVDDTHTDIVEVAGFSTLEWETLQETLNTYIDPSVENVSLSGTVPEDFTVGSFNGPAGTTPTFDSQTGAFSIDLGTVNRTASSLTFEFDVSQDAAQICDTKAFYTNLQVTYDDADGNTQTQAFDDHTLNVIGCPAPVVTAQLPTPDGANGWFNSDVTVSWSVSAIDQAYTFDCSDVTVDSDTPAAGEDFSCTATSPYGDATGSVNVKRDATDPVITFTGNAGTYIHGDQIQISCTAEDASSGIDSATCPSVDAPATDYLPGTYTLEATATDAAGNTADASATFEVIVDTTPPVIEATVTGAMGSDPWYIGPATVIWSVTDDESAIVSQSGCDEITVGYDTTGETFTCTAASAGGEASASVTVQVDQTAPTVFFTGNAGSYGVADPIAIDCEASDATSGLDEDATTCPTATGAGWEFGAGPHTLEAFATDFAGNETTESTSFTVTVDAAGICALVNAWVSGPGANGVSNSLCTKLNGRRPNVGAFINEVEAQAGKKLTQAQAATLIELAGQL